LRQRGQSAIPPAGYHGGDGLTNHASQAVNNVHYRASNLDADRLLAILHWMIIATMVGCLVAAVTFGIMSLGVFLRYRDKPHRVFDPFEDVIARLRG
jgi:hypothetical protein